MRQQAGTSLIILVAWETRKRFDYNLLLQCPDNVTPGEPGLNRKHDFREAALFFRLRIVSYKSLSSNRKELNCCDLRTVSYPQIVTQIRSGVARSAVRPALGPRPARKANLKSANRDINLKLTVNTECKC
jgi:hypothetical protein